MAGLKSGSIVLLAFALVSASALPASALTAKDKMATCKFGAEDQKLKGKERAGFITKCMANEKTAKTPAAKPAPKPALKPAT